MSLASIHTARRAGFKPWQAYLVLRDCPRPDWLWLRDDPMVAWLDPRRDVRSYDLRPLHEVPVIALVPDLAARREEVGEGLAGAGALLAGIGDGDTNEAGDAHWLKRYADRVDWRHDAAILIEAAHFRFFEEL